MQTLVDRFRNATVARFKERAYISTVAHRASLSRQRKATERADFFLDEVRT